jgi:hypothetical protein
MAVKKAKKTAIAEAAAAPSGEPVFSQPEPTGDPGKFRTPHASDAAAYKILDKEASSLQPLPFPIARGGVEPVLTLADLFGDQGGQVAQAIVQRKQIVFHALGDTGNTRSVDPQNEVTDKLVSDFQESDQAAVPVFLFHLGDVVYSFGEAKYYYDQFYDPYRNYPRPIVAIAGNHDGMVAPGDATPTLQAFLNNFCATGFQPSPDAGGLDRTVTIQPGVYFTLDAPLVRILGLYSNRLEDPGVISSQGGTVKALTDVQLDFLNAALQRIASEKFHGAVIIAVHHPPYASGLHGGSPLMLKDIDAACKKTGVWPHSVLSGHAHSYQRYTRSVNKMQIPYIIAGNGGHGLTPLTKAGQPALRVPLQSQSDPNVTFESYDDQDYGYLRVVVTAQQLRIEYHPASDGAAAKTPDDAVTVDLATRTLVHFKAASA